MKTTVIICDGCGKQTDSPYREGWFVIEKHRKSGFQIPEQSHLCSDKCVGVWAQRLGSEDKNANE